MSHRAQPPHLRGSGWRRADGRPLAAASAHGRRWTFVLIALVVTPLALTVPVGRLQGEGMLTELSLGTGLVALSLMVATFILPSRIRSLTSRLGIETVLRSHRAIAIMAVLFVAAHLVLVLATNPNGFGILNLQTAPARVWAACTATVALLALVVLALTRRRRRPRYEGWRMAHVVLSVIVLVSTALHVWWLRNLVDRSLTRWWFIGLVCLVGTFTAYRWAWRPLRLLRPARAGTLRTSWRRCALSRQPR